jgi:hypothetical protein
MDDAGLLAGIAENTKNTMETIQKRRDDISYQDYMKILQDNPDNPQAPEKVNYRVWNKAVVDHVGMQLQQGELQKQRQTLLKEQMEMGRENIISNAQRAESLVATNADAALSAYMDSYSKHPNGVNVLYNKETRMWDFKDEITGKSWSDNITLDEARQMTQAMLAPGAYEKVYLTDRSRVINYNQIAAVNPDILENSNGDKLTMFSFLDPNSGTKVIKYMDRGGNFVEKSPDELLRDGYKTIENNYEDRMKALGIKKKEKDIENVDASIAAKQHGMKIAQQRADAAGKKGGGAGLGALDKNVQAVMNAYDISKAEAMDLLRKDKNFGTLIRSALAEIDEEMLDTDDPKDAERIQSIYKKYGVDKLPGSEGLGLREKKGGKKETSEDDGEVPDVSILLDELKKQFPNEKVGAKKRHGDQVFIKTKDGWKQKE